MPQERQVALDSVTFITLYKSWSDAYCRDPATAGPPPVIPAGFGVEQEPSPHPRPGSLPSHPSPQPRSLLPHTSSPISSPRLGKSIVAKPDPFDGDKSKYVQWWRTMLLYLQGFEAPPTDRQKICIAMSYMVGDNAAGRFADLYFMQGTYTSATFDEFATTVRKAFQPAYPQWTAARELLKMKQIEVATTPELPMPSPPPVVLAASAPGSKRAEKRAR